MRGADDRKEPWWSAGRRGVLAKDTHGSTVRLAPPLVIAEEDLAFALDQLEAVLTERR